MDRENAIEVLRLGEPMQKTYSLMEIAICIAERESYLTDEEEATLREAVELAVKALEQEPCEKYIKEIDHLRKYIYKLETQIVEQEPCEDAISRSEAIRVASGYCHWSNIPEELAKLPSVNPIRCEDAISRKAVLALAKDIHVPTGNSHVYYSHRCIDPQEIRELPPVSIAEKTGRWIYKTMKGQFCSICDEQSVWKFKYCPNCGARMVEPQESEDEE